MTTVASMPFGLLSYCTSNLGDFIQSLAAHRFLPKVDRYIDREALDDVGPIEGQPVQLIMNGWFCHRPDRWPPSPAINPLLMSVHITNNPEPGSGMRAREQFARSPQVLRYLQEHGPVGARDHDTLAWLQIVWDRHLLLRMPDTHARASGTCRGNRSSS